MKTFHSIQHKLGIKGGAIALALVVFGVTACQPPEDTTGTSQPGQTTTSEHPDTDTQATQNQGMDNVEAGDLSGDLEDYLGRTVSIRGEVVEVLGQDGFVIGGGFLNDDVVVFNTSGSPVVLPGDEVTQRVQVTGQVQRLVINDVNQQRGLALDAQAYGQYENNPAILADSIVLAPEPGEISDNPQAFYDERIALEGGVDEEYGANIFTIGGSGFLGGSNILVINEAEGFANFENVDDVVVLGTLRPFNLAQMEQEYNLTLDANAQQSLRDDYNEASVLVADQIYPINR